MTEPKWDEIPTDEELLLARSVVKRLSRAMSPSEAGAVWDGLVEARRIITVSMDYLASYPGHHRHYRALWNRMLRQDQ